MNTQITRSSATTSGPAPGYGIAPLLGFGGVHILLWILFFQTATMDLLLGVPIVLTTIWIFYGVTVSRLRAWQNTATGSYDSMLSLAMVAGIALVLRAIMLIYPAVGEDDFQRYLFDGALITAGINPYAITPIDSGLAHLPPLPQVGTIYPPFAEGLFAVAALLGGTFEVWRLAATLADVAIMATLVAWVGRRNAILPLVIYGWNPLILKDLVNAAHVDVWAVLAIIGFLFAWSRSRHWQAASFITLATLTKLWPALLAVVWVRSLPTIRMRWMLAGFVCMLVACAFVAFFPFHPFANLATFFVHVEGRGALFSLATLLVDPDSVRRTLSIMAIGVLAYATLDRRWFVVAPISNAPQLDVARQFVLPLYLVLALFLFLTAGFPWYLASLVLLLCVSWRPTICAFMALTHVAYFAPEPWGQALAVAALIPLMLLIRQAHSAMSSPDLRRAQTLRARGLQ